MRHFLILLSLPDRSKRIRCNECVLECPVNGALEVKVARKTVAPMVILVLVVGLFFGSIGIAQLTGNFEILPKAVAEGQTIPIYELKGYNTIEEATVLTGLTLDQVYEQLAIPKTVPKETQFKNIATVAPGYQFDQAKADAGGSENAESQTSGGQNDGAVDVSGIKGSMTIQQAIDSLGMEQTEFYALFKIPEDIPNQTLMNAIVNLVPGYDFQQIKASLTTSSGTPEDNTSGTVDVSAIKGSMTIQQAIDSLGIGQAEFYALFKIPDNVPPETVLKEISTISPGYDFQSVKDSIQ